MTVSVVFCPYCLVAMKQKVETKFYICDECGHIGVPDKPDYTCPCANCAESQRKAG